METTMTTIEPIELYEPRTGDDVDPGKRRFDELKRLKREAEDRRKLERQEIMRSRAEAVRLAHRRVEEECQGKGLRPEVVEEKKKIAARRALAKMFPRIPPGSRVQYHDRSYIVADDGSYRREGKPSKAERRAKKRARKSS
jgi:hypothetical protein